MIKIVKATVKDLEIIRSLNQELFHYDLQFDDSLNVNWPKKNKKYYGDSIKSNNSCVLLIKVDDEVAGYLIGSISQSEDWRVVNKIAELENMLVVEKHRGKGLGSMLIQEFIEWARKKKVQRVRVVASAANEKTVHAYMKNGFAPYNNVMEMSL
jgi:GNAT superfamily N-acetyltransferase